MAFNLFDFSSLGGASSIAKTNAPPSRIGGATGGGLIPPTTTSRPLPSTGKQKIDKKPSIIEKIGNSLIPKASAKEITDEEISQLIDAGYTDEEIDAVAKEMAMETPKEEKPNIEPTKPTKPSFLDRVGGYAEKRGTAALELQDKPFSSFTKGAGAVGEGLGFIGDVGADVLSKPIGDIGTILGKTMVGKTAKAVLGKVPEGLKEAAKNAIESGGESWKSFEKSYPETARNITSSLQIGASIPAVGVSSKVALKTPEIVAESAVKAKQLTKEISEVPKKIKSSLETKYIKAEKEDFAKPTQLPVAGFKKATNVYKKAEKKGINLNEEAVKSGIKYSSLIDGDKFNTLDVVEQIRDTNAGFSIAAVRPALEAADSFTPRVSISNLRNSALSRVKGLDPDTTKAVKAKINSQFDELENQYPNGMNLTEQLDNKIAMDKKSGYNPTGTDADNNMAIGNKMVSDSIRHSLRNNAPKDAYVKEVFDEMSKQYQLADYLEALHTKKAPISFARKMVKSGAEYSGAVVGGAFGGGILGSFAGYHGAALLADKLMSMPSPVRNSILNNIRKFDPESADALMKKFIIKEKVSPKTLPLLPPSSGKATGAKKIIVQPTTPEILTGSPKQGKIFKRPGTTIKK